MKYSGLLKHAVLVTFTGQTMTSSWSIWIRLTACASCTANQAIARQV